MLRKEVAAMSSRGETPKAIADVLFQTAAVTARTTAVCAGAAAAAAAPIARLPTSVVRSVHHRHQRELRIADTNDLLGALELSCVGVDFSHPPPDINPDVPLLLFAEDVVTPAGSKFVGVVSTLKLLQYGGTRDDRHHLVWEADETYKVNRS
jgi:hypothetical protein